MKKAMTCDLVWRPREYHNLSIAQSMAAEQFINLINIEEDNRILDVGCGNGKISANLAKMTPRGSVLGLDISHEMIRFAAKEFSKKNYRNLQFQVQDAQMFTYINEFDVVFSSFALQWVKDKSAFFANSHKSLKNNGSLAIIVPLAVSPELEASVDFVINSGEWKDYFVDFQPGWFFFDSEKIVFGVEQIGFKTTHFFETVQEVCFPSRKALEQYILLWFPYLKPLPQTSKDLFFKIVMEEYFRRLPPLSDGTVVLKIPRMDLIARKTTL